MTRQFIRSWACVRVAIGVLLAGMLGCGAPPDWDRNSEQSFEQLQGADRIDVIVSGRGFSPTESIRDTRRIEIAIDFIRPYRTGWTSSWKGPRMPMVDLRFYRGTSYLGGFGLAAGYITVGGYHQYVPQGITSELARQLGLGTYM